MGDAPSKPAPAPHTAMPPAGWSEVGAHDSQRSVHDEALGWIKIFMCRSHLEALLKCQEQDGADCYTERAAVESCKEASERAAWRQLEQNAVVQCPQHFREYTQCMAAAAADARAPCKKLWIALHQCAAEYVVRHMEAQGERSDGGFTPPPMFTVQRTQRRRATPEEAARAAPPG